MPDEKIYKWTCPFNNTTVTKLTQKIKSCCQTEDCTSTQDISKRLFLDESRTTHYPYSIHWQDIIELPTWRWLKKIITYTTSNLNAYAFRVTNTSVNKLSHTSYKTGMSTPLKSSGRASPTSISSSHFVQFLFFFLFPFFWPIHSSPIFTAMYSVQALWIPQESGVHGKGKR